MFSTLLALVMLPAGLVTVYVLSVCYKLYVNYARARHIGLPVLFTPINPYNPLWTLTRQYVMRYVITLPFGLGNWARYSYLGWPFDDKGKLHARLGPAFVIVTPHQNQVVIADPHTADALFTRRKDFEKDEEFYSLFNVFGSNVNTTNGTEWQRHRKITTPPFNERNSSLVWEESVKQGRQILDVWLAKGSAGTTTQDEDLYLLTLHVLTAAGFGVRYEFGGDLATPAPGHALSYRDALRKVLANMFTTIIMQSAQRVPKRFLPKRMTAIDDAVQEFRRYMAEMVEHERQAHRHGESTSNANLMSSLVRASDEAAQANEKGSLARGGLTDDEIYGNLFIYNIAGHETTATIVSYAVAFLACQPKWQEWIGKEIDRVCAKETSMSYEHAFPELKRCLAVMHECLRLFAPLNGIPRFTGKAYQTLRIGDHQDVTIPPNTTVIVNNGALSLLPELWGEDALVWRPDRWIQQTDAGKEDLFQPVPGAFIPWASGPRICPGKKFSQVEFVGVLAALFREHRVRPVLRPRETEAEGLRRLQAVVDNSSVRLTIHMAHPEEMTVRWEKK